MPEPYPDIPALNTYLSRLPEGIACSRGDALLMAKERVNVSFAGKRMREMWRYQRRCIWWLTLL